MNWTFKKNGTIAWVESILTNKLAEANENTFPQICSGIFLLVCSGNWLQSENLDLSHHFSQAAKAPKACRILRTIQRNPQIDKSSTGLSRLQTSVIWHSPTAIVNSKEGQIVQVLRSDLRALYTKHGLKEHRIRMNGGSGFPTKKLRKKEQGHKKKGIIQERRKSIASWENKTSSRLNKK